MASNYSIEKLNSNNYHTWASDMKFLLMEKGVWEIIYEKQVVPVKSDLISEEDVKNFKRKSDLALSTIYMNIESQFRKLVENCGDPVTVWQQLKYHYCPDSRSFHMKLFTDLIECRKNGKENINLFASKLLRIYNQIKTIDEKFSEKYITYQLLRYLPACFDGIVQTILRYGDEDFSFDNVLRSLIAEENRLSVRESDGVKSASHNVEIKDIKRDFRCWICGVAGHLRKDCFKNDRFSPGKPRSRYPSRRNSRSKTTDRPDFRRLSPSPERFRSPPRGQSTHVNRGMNQRGRQRKKHFVDDPRRKSNFANLLIHSYFNETDSDCGWVFDSGASHHFCGSQKLFCNFKPLSNESMTVAIKDAVFPIEGKGDVKLKFGQRLITLKNVMYSSKLRRNLVSGPQLDAEGMFFKGGNGEVKVFQNNQFLFKAVLKDKIYRLFPRFPSLEKKNVTFESLTVNKSTNIENWHKKMGHVSPYLLIHTQKQNGVKGLPFLKYDNFKCDLCRINKFRRVSFKPLKQVRSSRPLDLIFADVWGPSPVPGKNGEKYFLSLIDDFSRKVTLYPIRMKADVFELIKKHITRAETFLGRRVKSFRSDNGGEFVNEHLKNYFQSKGIKHELTNVYSPEQNGVVERFNQTIVNGVRTIINESGLDEKFWPEAANYFAYTWNRVCSRNMSKTPLELYSGYKPSVRHLQPFGSQVFLGIPRQRRNKLDAKAKPGIMVGYAFRTRGYRIWCPDNNNIVETCNVSFKENCFYKDGGAVLVPEISDSPSFGDESFVREAVVEDDRSSSGPSNIPSNSRISESEDEEESQSEDEQNLKEVSWFRKAIPRKTGNRTDIYYFEEGKTQRLRSLNEVESYCKNNSIKYDSEIFNFSGNDSFSGKVEKPVDPDINLIQPQA